MANLCLIRTFDHINVVLVVCEDQQSENWFKPPMKVIDRTKAVTQHLLVKAFKKLSIKIIKTITILVSVSSWCFT